MGEGGSDEATKSEKLQSSPVLQLQTSTSFHCFRIKGVGIR